MAAGLLAIGLVGAGAPGRAEPPQAPPAAPAPAPETLSDADLRAAIEVEQARLLVLLRRPSDGADDEALYADPELRAIAERLPALQRQLRAREQPDASAR